MLAQRRQARGWTAVTKDDYRLAAFGAVDEFAQAFFNFTDRNLHDQKYDQI
jgi:hypothetical protein